MEIYLIRTFDRDIIKGFITHPAIWDAVSDDHFDLEDYEPNVRDGIYYLLEKETALFAYDIKSPVLAEVHSMVLPEKRGGPGRMAAQASLKWMFDNTDTKKIMTHVPVYNQPALVFALRNGLSLEGNNRKSFKKNGILHDQYLLGITRDEFQCQWSQPQP